MVWSLCISTLIASLLGSLHCAGMCGVFAALATCGENTSPTERMRLFTAYSAGRWVSYATLGAVCGILGQLFDIGAESAGFTNAAAIAAAAVVTLAGTSHILKGAGVLKKGIPVPKALVTIASHSHRVVNTWPPLARAFAIGLFTTMLPCHWLYTFAFTAAGSASASTGVLIMSFFWLGTLPALMAASTAVSRCLGHWRACMPYATATLMIATGIVTIGLRVMRPCCVDARQGIVSTILSSYCHGNASR